MEITSRINEIDDLINRLKSEIRGSDFGKIYVIESKIKDLMKEKEKLMSGQKINTTKTTVIINEKQPADAKSTKK